MTFKILVSGITALCLTACGSEPATIAGHEYMYTPVPDMEITLGFDAHENRYYGHAVNAYFGTYKADGKTLKLSPAGTTLMMGPRSHMEAERIHLNDLENVRRYRVDEHTLTLILADGREITLTRRD